MQDALRYLVENSCKQYHEMIKETCGVCVPLTSAFEWGKGPFSCQFHLKNQNFTWKMNENRPLLMVILGKNVLKTIKRFEKINFDSTSCANHFHWTSVVGRRCRIRHSGTFLNWCFDNGRWLARTIHNSFWFAEPALIWKSLLVGRYQNYNNKHLRWSNPIGTSN